MCALFALPGCGKSGNSGPQSTPKSDASPPAPDASLPADGAKVVQDVAPVAQTPPGSPATVNGVAAHCPSTTDPRVRDLQIYSPAVGGNVWVRLLLPPGWKEHPTRTWPVLYLLTGHGASYASWSCDTFVEQYIGDAGVLVVMPDGTNNYTSGQPPDNLANTPCKNDASPCGGTPGWYSNWYNGGDAGTAPRWETFHLTELRQILEYSYGAGHTRAVAGLSMGGFGSFSYAARNPGFFVAAAAYSGYLNPSGNAIDEAGLQSTLTEAGADPNALWGDPNTSTGLAVWHAHDPTSLAAKMVSLPLFVSSGNGCHGPFDSPANTCLEHNLTETVVHSTVENFVNALTKAYGGKLPANVKVDLYGNGTHAWSYWNAELCRSLPMLMKALNVSFQAPASCPTP